MQDKIIAQCQHYLAGGKTKEAIQLLQAYEIGDKNELVGALGRLNELGKKSGRARQRSHSLPKRKTASAMRF